MTDTPASAQFPSQKGKRCSKCKVWKRFTEFYVKATSKDGVEHWCKECRKAANILVVEMEGTIQEQAEAWHNAGATPEQIGIRLGIGVKEVWKTLAGRAAETLEPKSREVLRQLNLLRLDKVIEDAMQQGELKEARLAIMDQLKAVGIIQQGGATMNFDMRQQTVKMEGRLQAWLEKEGLADEPIDAEVTDDSDVPKALPSKDENTR